MLNIKKTLNRLLKQVNGLETVIRSQKADITVPSTTWTQLCKITLPAGGKYLLIAQGASGNITNGSNIAINLYAVSGSLSVAMLGSTTGSTVGGGAKAVVGYVETSADTEIGVREYLYGTGTTSNASGWIVAIPLRMGGVAYRLINTLQSLALRRVVIAC